MSGHITHLLERYTERLLAERQEQRVQQHLAACDSCREQLDSQERLKADLRFTLGVNPIPRQTQIEEWWQQIQVRQAPPQLRNPLSAMAIPAFLSLILLILPILSLQSQSINGILEPAETYRLPEVNTTSEPPSLVAASHDRTLTPMLIISPDEDVPGKPSAIMPTQPVPSGP